jgi:hypothetical protein
MILACTLGRNVEALTEERVAETLQSASDAAARFTYALERDPSVATPTVRYAAAEVTVLIPADQALTWCLPDQVGIVENISLGSQGSLDLIVGTDFACLDRSDEDSQDTFSNPTAGAAC